MATQQPQHPQPYHAQQPPTAPQNRLTQPTMQIPQNSQEPRPEPLPRHKQSLSSLQAMLNGILVETGKAIRSANKRVQQQSSAHPRASSSTTDTQRLQIFLPSAIPKFHSALDDIEAEIVRARAVIARDLRALRARKDSVSVGGTEEVKAGEDPKQDDAGMKVDSAAAQPAKPDQQSSQPNAQPQPTPAQPQATSQPQPQPPQMPPSQSQPPKPAQTLIPAPQSIPVPRPIAMVSDGLVTTSHSAAPILARAPHTSPSQQSQRQLPQTLPRQQQHQQLPQQGMGGVGVGGMGGVGGMRKMPEDEIAFNQLPGTADNSPRRPNANLPDQQPQSSPHQPSQTQQQPTPQVTSQAINQASAVQAAQMHQSAHAASQSQQSQPQQPNQLQPPPTQPSQPTHPQSQTQDQPAQNQGGTDDIDFDAMFGPPQNNEGETQNPETDINFDDFFNDVPDMSATQNSASQDQPQQNDGGLGEDAAFDLDSFGLDHVMEEDQSGGAATAGIIGEQRGVGLGLGTLESLESYAKMGGDDSMGGLDFSNTDQQPNQEAQAQQADENNNGNDNARDNAGGGPGDAQDSADQFDLSNLGHDGAMDLDFGDENGGDGSIGGGNVDMGNDGGASFDDLMMDFGNESGDMRGGGGGDEFDDFFNGL